MISRAALPAVLSALATAIAVPSQTYTTIGEGCPGGAGVPLLQAALGNEPRIAETFSAELSNVPDFGFAIGITGLSKTNWGVLPLPADLSAIGMPGCLLRTDIRRQVAVAINQGIGSWDLDLPVGPEWLGQSFYQQAFVLDDSVPGLGAVMSNATEGVVGVNTALTPQVAIIFPLPVSLTDADSIIVRGTASDPDGVADIWVNGVIATTTDGYANWEADVPLVTGDNVLVVEATDSLGYFNANAAQVDIERQAGLSGVQAMVLDPANNRTLAISGDAGIAGKTADVIALDLITKNRTTLSDPGNGSGPVLGAPRDIALNGTKAIVVDLSLDAVFEVDVETGDRTIVSMSPSVGTGPGFMQPLALVLSGSKALVYDRLLVAIVEVDLATGNRTIVSDRNGAGTGADFNQPWDIALDGSRILVADVSGGMVLAVDPVSGDRTVLSDDAHGTGPPLRGPQAIAVDGSRAIVSSAMFSDPMFTYIGEGLMAIDLATGDRTILASPLTGTGPEFENISSIVIDGARALVVDSVIRGRIIEVDLATGNRTVFSELSVGAGEYDLQGPLEVVGPAAIVVKPRSILSVDLASGDRTVVSDESIGSGPTLNSPLGVVINGNTALITDTDLRAVLAVDLSSGDRAIISDAGIGSGPAFGNPRMIALDGTRALVTDQVLAALLSVDLATGDRTIISDSVTGTGPLMISPRAVIVDGTRALVGDNATRILAIDLPTGDRTVISDSMIGSGSNFLTLGSIALDGSRLLTAEGFIGVRGVDLTTGNRSTLSGANVGKGPAYGFPSFLVRTESIAILTDFPHVLAVDTVTGERVIVAR